MEPVVGRRRLLLLCAVCQYPVRDVDKDFGPDGDHSPCAATLQRMESDLDRARSPSLTPWTLRW